MMTFSRPRCPLCNQPAEATLETVFGWAQLIHDAAPNNMAFEYNGETEIDRDTQRTVLDRRGLVTVQCCNRHQWQAMRQEISDLFKPLSPTKRTKRQ